MPDMLQIGLSGLLTFRDSLSTVSHNISNANTPGYSRQRTDLNAVEGQAFGNGVFGRGVGISSVRQITNRFVDLQLRESTTDAGRAEVFEKLSLRMDDLLAADTSGLTPVLVGMFDAMQALSADPSSAAARKLFLNEADNLAGRFHFLDSEIRRLDSDIDGELRTVVADINALSNDIANINNDIVTALSFGAGHPPNDLLDQRGERLRQLAALVAVRTIEQDNGALNVFIGNGQPIVVDGRANPLTTVIDSLDSERLQVARTDATGTATISDQLSGGEVGALLDFRRDVLPGIRNELGRVAAAMADAINAQHAQGMDFDGNLGGAVFSAATPSIFADNLNTGAATLTATITDFSALEPADYRVDYDGVNYTLTRSTDGFSTTAAAGPLVIDGVTITIAGAAAAGDSFLVKPVARAAERINLLISDPDRIAAASPTVSSSSLNNLGDGVIDQPDVADVTNAALLDDIDIVFNDPPNTFDVIDVGTATTLSAGVAFTEGADITVNGWTTRIMGNPLAGDSFRVESNVGGIGDNRNALALIGLQTSTLIDGRSSLQEGYSALVTRVGIVSRQAQFNAEAQLRLREDAQTRRDQISAVNLDEEAVDLTRYQRAYQAMAQTIETSNQLFNTLISAIS